MVRIALAGLGVWLLVATVFGLLLGQLMATHSVEEAGDDPLDADRRSHAA